MTFCVSLNVNVKCKCAVAKLQLHVLILFQDLNSSGCILVLGIHLHQKRGGDKYIKLTPALGGGAAAAWRTGSAAGS